MLMCFIFLFVPVLLIPAKCNKITVCTKDKKDLRVDCLLKPEPNKISTFQFSWSSGTKESVISTNVSGSSPDNKFKGKSTVQELKPHGYRMILPNFTDNLPHSSTFLCRLSGEAVTVAVEKGGYMIASVFGWCDHQYVTWNDFPDAFDYFWHLFSLPPQTNFPHVQL